MTTGECVCRQWWVVVVGVGAILNVRNSLQADGEKGVGKDCGGGGGEGRSE